MRKTLVLFTIAVFLLASTFNLGAGTLNGVTLPDTIQPRGIPLVLNGMGLRTKYMVKVYVAGLYLQQKSSDADAIIKADAPKRIVMQFLHGTSKSQMADAFNDSFNDNAPDAKAALKADVDRFLGQLDTVHTGDQMVFTYIPGTGTIFVLNGGEKLTVPGLAFAQLLFSVWLGPKPPNPELKKGLLGQ
ncbi:MAG TPA: chalcone isomerase family protein [Silvibacterium sp.]|nr:chalcone isomerase family protein [Silvibacterium sp.]